LGISSSNAREGSMRAPWVVSWRPLGTAWTNKQASTSATPNAAPAAAPLQRNKVWQRQIKMTSCSLDRLDNQRHPWCRPCCRRPHKGTTVNKERRHQRWVRGHPTHAPPDQFSLNLIQQNISCFNLHISADFKHGSGKHVFWSDLFSPLWMFIHAVELFFLCFGKKLKPKKTPAFFIDVHWCVCFYLKNTWLEEYCDKQSQRDLWYQNVFQNQRKWLDSRLLKTFQETKKKAEKLFVSFCDSKWKGN